MAPSLLAAAAESGRAASVSGGDKTLVVIIAVVALAALGVAYVFAREVMSASTGTRRMQEISRAVQEGAAAYLARQFRTLAAFAVLVFLALLLLPAANEGVRWGRSIIFLVGAAFSAIVGGAGMTLSTRAN